MAHRMFRIKMSVSIEFLHMKRANQRRKFLHHSFSFPSNCVKMRNLRCAYVVKLALRYNGLVKEMLQKTISCDVTHGPIMMACPYMMVWLDKDLNNVGRSAKKEMKYTQPSPINLTHLQEFRYNKLE